MLDVCDRAEPSSFHFVHQRCCEHDKDLAEQ